MTNRENDDVVSFEERVRDLNLYWKYLHTKISQEDINYSRNNRINEKPIKDEFIIQQINATRCMDMEICIDLAAIYGVALENLVDENRVLCTASHVIIPDFTLNNQEENIN